MSDHTYAVSEIVGTSTTGLEDAITSGLARASKTLRNLDWFEVTQIRGHLADGKVAHFQVGMKVGFRVEE
jgi:flavin-binding protein dodecin